MPMGVRQETELRLDMLLRDGRLDAAKAALLAGAPVPDAFGLGTEQAISLVQAYPDARAEPPRVEAIVRAVLRPPLATLGTDWILPPEFSEEAIDQIVALLPLQRSTGRFEIYDAGWMHVGSGWAVEETSKGLLVVTTRNAAARVARRTRSGEGVFLAGLPEAQPGAQIVSDDQATPLERFDYLADDASSNLALAWIAQANGLDIAPIPRAARDADVGEAVATLGWAACHAAPEDRTELAPFFAPLSGLSCICPGFLTSTAPDAPFSHDCTTLPGQSGAPIISLATGQAVGLHAAGTFGVGNAGVRVSTINRLLHLGAAGTVFQGAKAPSIRRTHRAEHFDGRAGYDPEFLKIASVPLPVTSPGLPLVRPADASDERPFELRYQGFGALCRAEGLVLLAANIDGSQRWTLKASDTGPWGDDRMPGVGHSDGWPALSASDLGWGMTQAAAKVTVDDAAHKTLCLPRDPGLEPVDGVWPALIEAALTHSRTHSFRSCVFAGPIVQAAPPTEMFKVIVVVAQDADDLATLRLKATAFLQSRGESVRRIFERNGRVDAWEGFRYGRLRTFQLRLRDLEFVTGHDFGELRELDPLDKAIRARLTQDPEPPLVFPIEAIGQVVL